MEAPFDHVASSSADNERPTSIFLPKSFRNAILAPFRVFITVIVGLGGISYRFGEI